MSSGQSVCKIPAPRWGAIQIPRPKRSESENGLCNRDLLPVETHEQGDDE